MPYVHRFIAILTLNYQNSIWLLMCLVAQLCPTLCDPMDCCLPGSSACGLFQASILEWGAISYTRGSFWPKDWTLISCISCNGRWILYHEHHLGKWKSLSRLQLFATLWTIQSTEFSRPEYWVGSCSLLQRMFPTEGSNPGLLHGRWILYQLSYQESPN